MCNLEGEADDLAFVTGTAIRKIGDRISGSAINVYRLKKASNIPASIIEPILNRTNGRLAEAIGSKDETVSDLDLLMQLHKMREVRIMKKDLF